MGTTTFCATSEETFNIGRELAASLVEGDIVLFEGQLGAGKTTMIRGILSGLGHVGPVRSPTFNLIQTYNCRLRVMHADLYRLRSATGLGLEEYLSDYLCLIEWPDRLEGLTPARDCWKVHIDFADLGRKVSIDEPEAD